MPKCYSDQEKEYIRKRLKEEAAKCLGQYGIRHTTVDEIVKRVNIPKGTFYLFYQSKELLLFDTILEIHDQIETELYQSFENFSGKDCNAEVVTDTIYGFYKKAAESPVLSMLNPDEVELLARKLSKEVLAGHLEEDNSMIEKIFQNLPLFKDVDSEVISTAFRSIYFMTLHSNEIGEEHFNQALRMLVYGIVIQFM